MSLLDKIKTQIQNLIGLANEKTGNADTDLTTAVNALVAGYGSGGSDEEFIGIKYSNFDSYRLSPKTADARSLPDETPHSMHLNGGYGYLFANSGPNPNNGWHGMLEEAYLPKLQQFGVSIFYNNARLKNIYGDFSEVKVIQNNAFWQCKALETIPYLPSLNQIFGNAFGNCTSLKEFKFYKKVDSTVNSKSFNGCTNLLDIYVPWSEGEVANAPWGATNATIHYNTVYDENHNPIV